jgi:hypothetical protein
MLAVALAGRQGILEVSLSFAGQETMLASTLFGRCLSDYGQGQSVTRHHPSPTLPLEDLAADHRSGSSLLCPACTPTS